MIQKALFKTKGGHQQGMGDVTSSLSIAECLRRKSLDVLFIVNDNRKVIDLVSANKFDYVIAEDLAVIEKYLQDKNIDIAILNQLNTPQEEALIFKKHTDLLVTIEDTGSAAQLADSSFNILYPIPNTIIGFSYIPLAKAFQKKYSLKKTIKKEVKNILVTQGGSDTYGFTVKIIRALSKIHKETTINVVIGPNFLHEQELAEALKHSPRAFQLIRGATDLSSFMLEADLAVTGGGNTLFELACLGVPAIVVCGEDFEEITARRLEKEGFGINLGFGRNIEIDTIEKAVRNLLADYKTRDRMSKAGLSLIDGYGAERIADSILKLCSDKLPRR